MDQGTYEYHGWQFERHEDGSLTIQPNAVENQAEKMDFTKQSVDNRNLVIPSAELPRLISFWLTGRPDDETVVSQIQNLGRVGSTV